MEALGFDSIAVFQSTLPRGERPGIMNLATFRGIFQSTLPRGERLGGVKNVITGKTDFNPRSREGSDAALKLIRDNEIISIHAPARGATSTAGSDQDAIWISIHAPARGATCQMFLRQPLFHHFNPRSREGSDGRLRPPTGMHRNFNPRSREGSDLNMSTWTFPKTLFQSTLPRGERRLQLRFSRWGIRISIHAPARGATTTTWQPRQTSYNFNPRSREGSDHDRGRCEGNGDDFNPRSREGSDKAWANLTNDELHFNPRSREGSDSASLKVISPLKISIHAPARGATFSLRNNFRGWNISIHAPARGATRQVGTCRRYHCISIHAPARGATITEAINVLLDIFQSTLPRGERLR